MRAFEFGWKEIDLEEEPVSTRLGSVTLWLRRPPKEFALAYRYSDASEEEEVGTEDDQEAVSDPDWLRWAVESEKRKARLSPAFPDLPVVVRPSATFRVARGSSARIFVRVPIWIQIEFAATSSYSIQHYVPSRRVAKTWSGSSTAGDLCYWVSTSARREVQPDMFREHLAICPVDITNESEDDLLVERLTLRVPHLSLFLEDRRLWSDETQVSFQGGGKVSRVEVRGGPPPEAERAQPIASPRRPVVTSFSARTFSRIKDLPGFGLLS